MKLQHKLINCKIVNDNVCVLQELKRVNHDLEAKVNELSSTCMLQKEEFSKLASEESGSEVTINKIVFLLLFKYCSSIL